MALCLIALGATQADARVRWSTPASYRFRVTGLGEFPLDEAGTDTGQRLTGRHRLRIDPIVEVGMVTVYLQIDVLTGQIFGDPNPVGADFSERRYGDPTNRYVGWTTVEPRQAWLELDTDWFGLQFGQMGIDWGMGLIASDGQDRADDGWVERMGDRWAGDLAQRLKVSVRPLAAVTYGDIGDLVLSVGADHLYQDELASFLDDDSAYQFFGQLVYPGDSLHLGLYVVHREQEDADGETFSSTAFDVFGRWEVPLYRMGADLRIQGEAVLLTGHTGQVTPNEADLLQLGWATRAEIRWRCPRVALGLETGYASGDADPTDSEVRGFTFDPDYRVGFILFDDVLRLITARGAERLADPLQQGVAPALADSLPTDGAVRNAWYITPGVTWRPGPWRLSLVGLLAWASAPFLDVFNTFEAGGAPRNHLRAPTGRFYGAEMSGSAHYDLDLPAGFTLTAGAQVGMFVPGAAIDPAGIESAVGKAMGRLDLRW